MKFPITTPATSLPSTSSSYTLNPPPPPPCLTHASPNFKRP
ncbi:hypothetical protein A2U01_0090704, partial [Trifolium medium]|nr:hypothetical protein [Trifolium medium]